MPTDHHDVAWKTGNGASDPAQRRASAQCRMAIPTPVTPVSFHTSTPALLETNNVTELESANAAMKYALPVVMGKVAVSFHVAPLNSYLRTADVLEVSAR